MSIIKNNGAFLKALDNFEKEAMEIFRIRVRKTVSEAMRRLIAGTPVNTGQTVASYAVNGAGTLHPGWDPVEPTNDLPLGAEKLRPKAEAIARQNLDSALADIEADPFQYFEITNSAPQAAGLEAGELPRSPYVPRSPQGMFRVTNAELLALLQSNKI